MKHTTVSVSSELMEAWKKKYRGVSASWIVDIVLSFVLQEPDFLTFLQNATIDDVRSCCYVARAKDSD